jgi:hypothetical protein
MGHPRLPLWLRHCNMLSELSGPRLLTLSPAVLTAHARDELGIDPDDLANPVQVTKHVSYLYVYSPQHGCRPGVAISCGQHVLVPAVQSTVPSRAPCVLSLASSQSQRYALNPEI